VFARRLLDAAERPVTARASSSRLGQLRSNLNSPTSPPPPTPRTVEPSARSCAQLEFADIAWARSRASNSVVKCRTSIDESPSNAAPRQHVRPDREHASLELEFAGVAPRGKGAHVEPRVVGALERLTVHASRGR
jgi:hypothetical protein